MRCHLRFQNLHAVRPQELVNRILRVFQIGELSRPGRTDLTTCGGQSLGDPVIAERALFAVLVCGLNKPAAVGASLHAVAATEAVFLIDQHHAIGMIKVAPTGQTWVQGDSAQ